MSKFSFYAQKDWPYHVSSGAVVYRRNESSIELLLLHRYKGAKADTASPYGLPKGTINRGESLEQGAIREIKEETGFDVELQGYLGGHHAQFENPYNNYEWDRITHYFVAEATGGDQGQQRLDDVEFYKVKWCSPEEAKDLLMPNPKKEHIFVERALLWMSKRHESE
jgi:8-oxo-dGTP diphosphatase